MTTSRSKRRSQPAAAAATVAAGRRRRTRPARAASKARSPRPAVQEHGPPADLITRLLTGVAIAVVALIMLKLGTWATTILVAVIVGAAAFELYEAFRRAGYHPATLDRAPRLRVASSASRTTTGTTRSRWSSSSWSRSRCSGTCSKW